MKGFIIIINALVLVLSFFIQAPLYAGNHATTDSSHTILILKSRESQYYNKTIHTLSSQFKNNTFFDIRNINETPKLGGASIVIALGMKASQYSRKNFADTPKILAFLTQHQSKKLSLRENEIHLFIEQSLERYFSFAQALFPSQTVATLSSNENALQMSNEQGTLKTIHIGEQNDIITATRQLIRLYDVFLATPNKTIFNRKSLKGILLNTYQSGTPLISYSPSHVKAGAVAAIYSSPTDLGKHIAEVTMQLQKSKHILSTQQFSKYYSIKINRRVAQSLRLHLPSNEEIFNTIETIQ